MGAERYLPPVAWKLRMWLIRFLAGRHCVVLNLYIEDGTLYPRKWSGTAMLVNVMSVRAPGAAAGVALTDGAKNG